MLCSFILLVIIRKIIYQKIINYIVENSVFLLLCCFKMQMKMSFMVLEIWLIGFGRALEKFWKFFRRSWYTPYRIVYIHDCLCVYYIIYIILYYIILFYIILYYIILYYFVLHYIVLSLYYKQARTRKYLLFHLYP